MQLAHALNNGLPALGIARNTEARVFRRQTLQRRRHLVVVRLRFRFDRNLDNRIREFHPLEDDRLASVAKRIARGHSFKARDGNDVAGTGLFDIFAAIGMHQKHTTNALFLIFDGVLDTVASAERAGIIRAR